MFGKIFTQIYDSSIAEDWTVRTVFQDMVILADINGVVDLTPESLARRTNVPLDVVANAISVLERPDPKSRSPEEGGARIRLLDDHRVWGWEIINYRKYREIASDEQRRELTKLRTRKWRGSKDKQNSDAPVTHGDACDAMQKQKQREMESVPTPHVPLTSVEPCLPNPIRNDGNGNGSVVLKLERVEWLKERLEEMYNRPKGRRWGCEEEHLLNEIASRPDHKEELRTIQKFRPKVPARSFPQSLLKLLTGWDSTLDRARTVTTYDDRAPEKSLSQKEHEAAMRRIAEL